MTRKQMAAVMDKVFDECMALRDAGQKEYAHDEDNAFANFERVAKDLGIPREKVLWIFAMKHRDGIVAHINGHTSQRENVRGRINDLIVYLCLLRAMLDENEAPARSFMVPTGILDDIDLREFGRPGEAVPVHKGMKL
jgi:hypothetical protein